MKKSGFVKRMSAIVMSVVLMLTMELHAHAGVVTVVGGIGTVSANTSNTSSQYSGYWEYWSQGASQYSGMRKGGCRVTAFAKLIKEAGYADYSNPDEFLLWGISNGFFKSTSNVLELGTFGNAIGTYISQRGGSCSLIATHTLSDNATDIANMMNYINQGYYIVLSCAAHTAYVGRAASISQGTPVILDSWSSWTTKPASCHTYTGRYDSMSGCTFEKYRVYSISQKQTDTTPPEFSGIWVSDISTEGYYVNCFASDESGIRYTYCITKSADGAFQQYAVEEGNGATNVMVIHYVDVSDQSGGTYYTEVYAQDNNNNLTEIHKFEVYVDRTAPVISNIRITDIGRDGYTVSCEVTDDLAVAKVCFPTWTDANGQDDLDQNWIENATAAQVSGNTYSFRVNTASHNNEHGTYITHIYAYDTFGNSSYVCQGITAEVPCELPFTDVVPDNWYYEYVADVYEKGYMVGSGTAFRPNELLTRAEIVTTLYSMSGKPSAGIGKHFTDVADGQWYSLPVSWAYENSIASGYGNGSFGIADLLTREQFALMLYQYAVHYGYETSYSDNALSGYQDIGKISVWANTAMKWAVSNEIIGGKTAAALDPQGEATRAECATMITGLMRLKK